MRLAAAIGIASLVAADASAQKVVEQTGPFQHVGSGTLFPEQFGEFGRGRIVRYEDPAGEDISVAYGTGSGGGQVVLTEYVYPAPAPPAGVSREELCNAEFDGSAAEIDKHDGSRRLGEPAAPPVGGIAPALARRAKFIFDMESQGTPAMLQSELVLYCYVGGNWFLKYRATSLPGTDLDGALTRFITAGPWPGKKF